MYVPSLTSNPFVLYKIWSRQESIIKKKLLRRNNYVNIKCMIMVLVHCPSTDCNLSINQVPFQSLLDRHPLWNQSDAGTEVFTACKMSDY